MKIITTILCEDLVLAIDKAELLMKQFLQAPSIALREAVMDAYVGAHLNFNVAEKLYVLGFDAIDQDSGRELGNARLRLEGLAV